jgi:hypothetical protein
MEDSMSKISLGKGVLTWDGSERRSDRYGTVWLIPEGSNSLTHDRPKSLVIPNQSVDGDEGEIIALVEKSRDSTHVGDFTHMIFPERPEVGEIIALGNGQLFFEGAPFGGCVVGLMPLDHRDTLWLDIRALYRAHEQSVELFFVPNGAAS